MVYLDNSATTRPSRAVRDAMAHSMEEVYFNPSALYGPAMQAEKELTFARKALADRLGVPAKNVIFTSGGTESRQSGHSGPSANPAGQGRGALHRRRACGSGRMPAGRRRPASAARLWKFR